MRERELRACMVTKANLNGNNYSSRQLKLYLWGSALPLASI